AAEKVVERPILAGRRPAPQPAIHDLPADVAQVPDLRSTSSAASKTRALRADQDVFRQPETALAMTNVAIRRGGVAACCASYLLRRAGFGVNHQMLDRPRLPAIMLSEHALALIRDVFNAPNLFRNAFRIEKRMVAWGRGSELLPVAHSGAVVSEE